MIPQKSTKDEITSQTEAVVAVAEPVVTASPNPTDVGQTLKAAWNIVKKTWINLTAWTILWYLIGSVFFVVILVALLGIGWWQLGSEAFVSLDALLAKRSILFTLGGVGLLVFIAFGAVLGSVMQIGYLLMVGTHEETLTLGNIFSRAFRILIPLMLTGVLVGLLVMGGFGLFIIPGIVISIMTIFWIFEVVFDRVAYSTAIRNSLSIFQQNFGFLFERWLVMVGLAMAWSFGVMLMSMILSIIPLIGPLLQMVLQLAAVVFGWFVLAFWYVVYTQARATTDLQKKTNTTWVWVVAVVGWIMLLLVGYGLYMGIRTIGPAVIESIQKEIEREQNRTQNQTQWNLHQSETSEFTFDVDSYE